MCVVDRSASSCSMRATALPDMDAKLSDEDASRLKRQLMIGSLNAKADWMERTMKPLLPRDIYRMVWDESGTADQIEKRRETVRRYLKRQDIRIEEHGLNARIFKGNKLISQFFVTLANE